MASVERFPHAPITEALLDIRVSLPKQIDLAKLETYQDAIKEKYPTKRVRKVQQLRVEIKEGEESPLLQQTGGPDGFLLTSADGKQIVQARLDGFTFSRLKPYDKWESLRDEARSLWKHYIKIAAPESVTRIALRYINRIEIPLPFHDFKDYILTIPEIAPTLPQALDSFFMRLVITQPSVQATAIVTETIEQAEPTKEKAEPTKPILPLILDIDVFRFAAFEADSEEMWTSFERLRDFKNSIFFDSMTPKAKELFR